ncbi:MAG: tetratricopeptide repeat protein [Kiritimatiellae bacterium]|nr:tetratricopeptide repeat protein [Kiritimatiellia bacterium]
MEKSPNASHVEESNTENRFSELGEYLKPLAIGMGVLVLVGGGFLGFRYQKQSTHKKADALLSSATTREALQQIVEAYPSTPIGPIALLSSATKYFNSKQYALAQSTYKRFFLEDYPDHIMKYTAELGSAYCQEASGQYHQARESFLVFEKAHPDHYLTPLAVFGQARCFAQAGQGDDARVVYEDFIAANPEGDWGDYADLSLKYLEMELRIPPVPFPTLSPTNNEEQIVN